MSIPYMIQLQSSIELQSGNNADMSDKKAKFCEWFIRRRGAYLLNQKGMGIKELQRYLGHASVTTTERYLAIEDGDVLAAHRRASPVDRAGL